MKKNLALSWVMTALLMTLAGCGGFSFKASTNDQKFDAPQNLQTSFELRETRIKSTGSEQVDCNPKKHKDVLVLLALSGGGSRAALLSGLSMLELQKMKLANGGDVLSEVDAISSVSGGTLAAAYFASAGDPESVDDKPECAQSVSGRVWGEDEVIRLMSKDYIGRWIGSWFWPENIFLYWFSTYDRTDMMAQTFADNLFDSSIVGKDLLFADLNPKRPNLIINATQGSINAAEGRSNAFGQPFTFTKEDFEKVCSSIDQYELSRGVMASATFPGVFNFMTLENYCNKTKYVHLFDGGNSDNLGLTSLKRQIWNLHESHKLSSYRKMVVILVDAYTDTSGVQEEANDPRRFYDYIVDTNFITATDSLLAKNRDALVNDFDKKEIFPYGVTGEQDKKDAKQITMACKKFFSWEKPEDANEYCTKTNWEQLNKDIADKMIFVHVAFDQITDNRLKKQLNNIATDFKFKGGSIQPRVSMTRMQLFARFPHFLDATTPAWLKAKKFHRFIQHRRCLRTNGIRCKRLSIILQQQSRGQIPTIKNNQG